MKKVIGIWHKKREPLKTGKFKEKSKIILHDKEICCLLWPHKTL
jgi:hypothetical protein